MKYKLSQIIAFFLFISLITSIKLQVTGVVDKIDNMEELGKPNKIDVYKDMRAD